MNQFLCLSLTQHISKLNIKVQFDEKVEKVHQMEEEMCNLSNEVNLWLKNENNLKTSSNKVTNDRVHLLLSKPQKFVFYGSQKN